MIIEVKVPQLSESVAEATLAAWHVKEGDAVARDAAHVKWSGRIEMVREGGAWKLDDETWRGMSAALYAYAARPPAISAMRLATLDHLVLTVADVDATVAFYVRVLGMDEVTFGAGRRALAFGDQDPEFAEWIDDKEKRASLVEELPLAAVLIYRYWHDRRRASAARERGSRRSAAETARKTRERLH